MKYHESRAWGHLHGPPALSVRGARETPAMAADGTDHPSVGVHEWGVPLESLRTKTDLREGQA